MFLLPNTMRLSTCGESMSTSKKLMCMSDATGITLNGRMLKRLAEQDPKSECL